MSTRGRWGCLIAAIYLAGVVTATIWGASAMHDWIRAKRPPQEVGTGFPPLPDCGHLSGEDYANCIHRRQP